MDERGGKGIDKVVGLIQDDEECKRRAPWYDGNM